MPPSKAPETLLHYASARCTIVSKDNTLVAIWRKAATLSDLDAVGHAAENLYAVYPDGLIELSVLYPLVPTVSIEIRDRAIELAKVSSARQSTTMMVLMGEGFWASAVRSVVTGINLLAHRSDRMIFTSLDDALVWAHAHIGTTELWAQGVRSLLSLNGGARAIPPRDSQSRSE